MVTVSTNPSVDQLAACIGLTLALNKLDKHASAVFSGEVPSTLEFLQPDKTFETNTDSLRDFIISLDKAKADKIRYKVEENIVKIYITPYKTSIGEEDFEFGQGDFNVDVVLALGVRDRNELDQAIVAHGRILHDATVIAVNTSEQSELGSINWTQPDSSSLCEMASNIVHSLGKDLLNAPIATALLTGMVSETDRFGNEKATPKTMAISGTLMAAGASTALISSKLEEYIPAQEIPPVVEAVAESPAPEPEQDDGFIHLDHDADIESTPMKEEQTEDIPHDDIHIDEHGTFSPIKDVHVVDSADAQLNDNTGQDAVAPSEGKSSIIMSDPPQLGGQLTANSVPEHQQYSPSTDPLSTAVNSRILSRTPSVSEEPPKPVSPEPSASEQSAIPRPDYEETKDDRTLSEIEREIGSPHADEAPPPEENNSIIPPPPPVPPPMMPPPPSV